jgi:hypothetical protein
MSFALNSAGTDYKERFHTDLRGLLHIISKVHFPIITFFCLQRVSLQILFSTYPKHFKDASLSLLGRQ